MPRLLRLFRCHMYGSLARGCGGILFAILHASPVGGSTLITSAPKSDKITAAPGPAMKLARSTTFNPEKILSLFIGCVPFSPALKLRRTLFEERGRPFLFVFG